MNQSGDKLLSLLTGSGRKLVNFKFLPGDNPTSGQALRDTAYEWLEVSRARGQSLDIPPIGAEQIHIGDIEL